MSTTADFNTHLNKCKKVIKKYGTTRKYECAGFILPDGKMIDFCKKKKSSQFDTSRTYEHYEMVKEYYQKQEIAVDISPFQRDCGAIRIRRGQIRTWISAVRKPTTKQVEQLKKAIGEGCDRLYAVKIDHSKENEDERICEYVINQPRPLDIQKWINKCWR